MIRYLVFQLLLGGIILCGCNRSSSSYSPRVGLLKGPSALALIALEEIADTVAGEAVSYLFYDNPQAIVNDLLQEKLDIAALPLTTAVNLYNKGIPYRLMGVPLWGSLAVVERPSTSHADTTDLYLLGRGSTPEILAKRLLPEQKYRLRYGFETPSVLALALLSKKINRALLPEPFVSMLLRQDSSLYISYDLAERWDEALGNNATGFPQTALLVRNQYLNRISDAPLLWDTLFCKAIAALKAHPENYENALIDLGIVPPQSPLPEIISRCRIHYLPYAVCHKEIMHTLSFYYQIDPNMLGGKLPNKAFGIISPGTISH